ncbi:MAG TPA: flagellar basal body P-ring protein FlgI [Phycisphaerae bacterium]|nr:flagellar basal body P-ring protein FlgI [Phycisphaerales bacterium]HRX87136.1 flagellar basal body P-ring protein FlgI [Phycisphaerae bacterium]
MVIGCSLLAGCSFTWDTQPKKPDVEKGFVDAKLQGLTDSAAYHDTVAEQGWIEGLRFMRVRGYGLVAGLGDRGSSECPEQIRDRLVQEMYKRTEFTGPGLKPARITPEQIIDDADTAVVLVEGQIPAAAQTGDTFDVTVRALPGTQTVSLEGGRLYTADLHIFREVGSGSVIEGQTLATADGAIFINPFDKADDERIQLSAREGMVIGGGKVSTPRRLRFVLTRPSFQRVRHISNKINARFPELRKVAEATTPSYIELRVPAEFADDPFHFLALVRHLYLPERPGFLEDRTRKLADEIVDPDAPHPDIALAWEGIGRTVLPTVQKLYTDSHEHARFYAAVTGLRLGDDVAVEVLSAAAHDEASAYRLTAIEELGRARKSFRAAGELRELLNDSDPRIRVEAYEALLARGDVTIRSEPVGENNFTLDQVPSAAGNLIYVRRTGAQRMVLFGTALTCPAPVYYRDPSDMITISAQAGDEQLTLVRRTNFGHRQSPPLAGPTDLPELIHMLGDDPVATSDTDVHGLALGYSTITRTVADLSSGGFINADFMLQTASVEEMFGPLKPGGRPESEPISLSRAESGP